ncbi:MAG: gamma carbonic anhydrase family protein [Clostridia bacterium]|nr:gamma carbonic anhydrase family protein [Clostridia bacterium]
MIYNYKEHSPKIHDTCFIAPGSFVIGQVVIGKYSSVWYNTVIRGDTAAISIGENTNIQDNSTLHCIKNTCIKIGDNVTIGHGSVLHSCVIGNESLIGIGAIILDKARVGNNCLISAGAVVTPRMEIPDCSLVMGSPARVKRTLTEEEIKKIKNSSEEYVRLADEYKNP